MTTTATELFDRHHLAVFRYFRRMVGEDDLAQDLTQEVFLRVVEALPRYDERGRAVAWVFTIANNVLFDHRRRPERSHLSLTDADPIAPEASHVAAFGFNEALGLVPGSERGAFLLHELVGLSYERIAEVLGITQEGVRSKVFRARKQIRQLLSSRLSGGRTDVRRRDP
jgi:RNA polymerase sigma-70 factor (ECF subfamily)